jgi:hypothetical protein
LTVFVHFHATFAAAMAAANTVRRAKSPPAQPRPGLALVATNPASLMQVDPTGGDGAASS